MKPILLLIVSLPLIALTGCAHKNTHLKTPPSRPTIHITGIEKEFNNFHSVQPGLLYRSAQLSPKFLEKIVTKLGIKTIINLRGTNKQCRWWNQEQAIAKKLGIHFYNIPMTAARLPEKKYIIKLLNIYQTAAKPILIHCYSGADRTGEAAALWILEYQKHSKKEALKQLSLKYGHIAFKYPAKRRFIKLWRGKQWLIHEYSPIPPTGTLLQQCNRETSTGTRARPQGRSDPLDFYNRVAVTHESA